MEKETVVLFLDYANINRAAREKRYQLDYGDFLQYVGENRFLVDAYCYVPINPRNEHRLDGAIEDLWRSGYVVHTKMGSIAGGTYKCNFDVEITMDILKVVQQVKPAIVVLASGDADFVSLVQDIRKSGIRVEVAAFPETAGATLLLKSSGFIDLTVYYDAYLEAHKREQEAAKREERYQDLIQAQNGQAEEQAAGREQQGAVLSAADLDEEDESVLAEQLSDETPVPAPDLVDTGER